MPGDITRVELNSAAIRKLLQSPEVAAALLARGQRAADAAGPGFVAKTFYGFDRVSVIVSPDSSEALTALYEDSTVLTRAIGAARG